MDLPDLSKAALPTNRPKNPKLSGDSGQVSTSPKKTSNRVEDLEYGFQSKIRQLIDKGKQHGISFKIRETYRPKEVQDEYYKQGRSKPGSIITYAKGNESDHQFRQAIDIDPSDGNYRRLGQWAAELGLKWGGNWKWKDWGHVYLDNERKTGGKLPDLSHAVIQNNSNDIAPRSFGIPVDAPEVKIEGGQNVPLTFATPENVAPLGLQMATPENLKKLGMAPPGVDAEAEARVAAIAPQIDELVKVSEAAKSGQRYTPQTPVPEAPQTLEAQRQAAADPASTRIGTLYTPGEKPTLRTAKETDIKLADRQTLRADRSKLFKFLIKNKVRLKDVEEGRVDITELIGGKADPTDNTSGKQVVVTRDKKTGAELVASTIEKPSSAKREAKLQQAQFPNVETATSLTDSDTIGAERIASATTDADYEEYSNFIRSQGQEPLPREEFDASVRETDKAANVTADADLNDPGAKAAIAESMAQKFDTSPKLVEAKNDKDILRKGSAGTFKVDFADIKGGDIDRQIFRKTIDHLGAEYDIDSATLDRFVEHRNGRYLQGDPYTLAELAALKKAGHSTINGTVDNATVNELLKFAKGDDGRTIQTDLDTKIRMENAQIDRSPAIARNIPTRLNETDSEKALDARIKEKSYSAQQKASEFLSDPWNLITPFALVNLPGAFKDAAAPPSDEWVASEKKRLIDQHGSYAKAWDAEKYYQDATWGETAMRAAVQTTKSFAKNLIGGTGKSLVFLSQLQEDTNIVNKFLPDEAKIGLRNVGNLTDLAVRLVSSRDSATALREMQWAKGTDPIEKQQFFQAMKEFDKAIGDDPVLKGRFFGSLADAGGSALAFVALGAVMPSLSIVTRTGKMINLGSGLAGALQSAGAGYEEGKGSGLSEKDARTFGVIQGLLGTTEMFGAGAELTQILKAHPTLGRRLASALLETAQTVKREAKQEFWQEVFQTTSGKVVLEYLKDNDPSTLAKLQKALNRLPKQIADAASNEGLTALITGGGMGAVTSTVQKAMEPKETDDAPVEETPIVAEEPLETTTAPEKVTEPKPLSVGSEVELLNGKGRGVIAEDRGKNFLVNYNPKTNRYGTVVYQSSVEIRKDRLRDVNIAENEAKNEATVENTPVKADADIADLTVAANEAATSPTNDLREPTEGQKEAGNYKKGHYKINGLDLTIENPVASERKGVNRDGKAWSVKMDHHYGYIKRTVGADTEQIDVFVKDNTPAEYEGPVFIVDQVHPDNGKFDEHKVLLGFANETEARDAYAANYAADWKGLQAITEMPFDQFKTWVRDGEKTEPIATPHKFSSTQANLPKGASQKVRLVGRKLIPDSEIYTDADDPSFGREEQPHVTVKYGLHSQESKEVEDLLAAEGPIKAKLGKITIFEGKGGTPYDVVKADVESPDLHRLNKLIADNTKVTDTFPTYVPHVTLAYVKKGNGKKYVGKTELEGTEIDINSIMFSSKTGETKEIPLKGKRTLEADAKHDNNTRTDGETDNNSRGIQQDSSVEHEKIQRISSKENESEPGEDVDSATPSNADEVEKPADAPKQVNPDAPSANEIVSRFSKSGPWNKYSRRFHNLSREGKERTIELIQDDMAPEKALNKVRRELAKKTGDAQELGDAAVAVRHLSPKFYLSLQKDIEAHLPNKASVSDVKGFIESRASKAERSMSGITSFLNAQSETVDKQELLDFLKANTPNLKVVVKDDSGPGKETFFSEHTSSGGENYQEIFITAPDEETTWHQGHEQFSDVRNPLVHLRTKDGLDAAGNLVLRVEEIQKISTENQALMPEAYRKHATEIAIKYAIQYAYDNDFDTVTFTKGETQNKRWGLSKVIDGGVEFALNDGQYDFTLNVKGKPLKDSIPEADLETYWGKPVAKLIKERGASGKLSREDLSIADPDLSYDYDKIQAKFIRKYTNRLGGEFSESEIKTDEGTEPVYRVDLTPDAKDKIKDGQELFFPGEGSPPRKRPRSRGIPDPFGSEFEDLGEHDGHAMAMSEVRLPLDMEPEVGYEKSKVSNVKVIQSYSKILKDLGRPTPIRLGRISSKNARGVYKPHTEIIRLREAGNIPTAAHETFHAIQKVMFGAANSGALNPIPRPALKELVKLGQDLYGSIRPSGGYRTEGFAEFGRYYLTRDDAQAVAPEMYRYFTEEFLAKNPDLEKSVGKAREVTDAYRKQGAKNRAEANVSKLTILSRISKAIKLTTGDAATQMVDELTPLLRFTREVEDLSGTFLSSGDNPFKVASFLRGNAAPVVHFMATEGMLDAARNRVGRPLSDVGGIVRGKSNEFAAYLIARRALERWTHDKNPGMSKEDAAFLFENLDSPEFQMAADIVYDWNNGVLNYVKGLVPEMQPLVDKIQRNSKDYVPLMREMNEGELRTIAGRYSGIGHNALFQMKGSGRRIKPIFPQMIANAERMIGLAHKRKVLDVIVALDELEGVGSLLEQVPRDKVPTTVSIQEIEHALERAGADLKDVDLDQAITFFTPAKAPKGEDPIIPVVKDGKILWYQIPVDLYNTLSGLDLYRLPKVVDWFLGAPTRLFRLGTTGLRASFSLVTNPLRDVQTVMMQTQSKNPAKLMANYVAAMTSGLNPKRLAGKTPADIDLFYRLGVNLAQPLGIDEAVTSRYAKQLFQSMPRRIVSSPINTVREIFSIPEAFPRVAEIKTIAKEIGWIPGDTMTFDQAVQLGLAGKQVTVDFSAAGKAGKVLNQTVPFFNANVQGSRSFLRAFKRNPTRSTLIGLLTITLPTLLLWWRNRDEEWWKDMPEREKNAFWNIRAGDEIIQIPRAQEWGGIFATVPEAIADSWYKRDPEGFMASMGYMFDLATPPMEPVLVKIGHEQWANRIEFFDRPIVPKGEENLPPSEQYGAHTSDIAKWLGENLPDAKFLGVPINSPRRIDAAIRSVGGGLGSDLAQSTKGFEDAEDREMTDIPVAGRLFRRGGTFGSGSKTVDRFYDDLAKARQKAASLKNEEPDEDRVYRLQLERAAETISKLRKLSLTATAEGKRSLAERGREAALMTINHQHPYQPKPERSPWAKSASQQKEDSRKMSDMFPGQTLIPMPSDGKAPTPPKAPKRPKRGSGEILPVNPGLNR